MFQQLYTSVQARPMGPEDINAILRTARRANHRLGVTGVLVYHDGEFLQVLEGREPVVRALYAVIEKDRRHRDCTVLVETTVENRLFPDWDMAYVEPSPTDKAILEQMGVRLLDHATVERLSYDPSLCRSVMYGLMRVAAKDRFSVAA